VKDVEERKYIFKCSVTTETKGTWEKSRNAGFRVDRIQRGLPIQPRSSTLYRGSAYDSHVKVDFVGTQGNACYDVIRTGLEYERRTKNASREEGNEEHAN
jgi:hypothetical protein